ncbi:carotenoid biosynthesis protein [Leptobacterium flavescens]|uniref:Carotenoid biosynthesis protein n=1 Tax=Leptobacterium flavescens TaxID=472055 RepID=A0A6P0UMJ7_9FLAO|nr:carotenoid biosynthesis protein [Leptobacterium flavescens]NER13069.1 carotenoid biosynthesis protein [Leptobacterium flavescens]
MGKPEILKLLLKEKLKVSIALIWLLNALAIIGIYAGFESVLVALTPLNLICILFLILWHTDFKKQTLIALSIPFLIGLTVSYLGVNYGLIFGPFSYGENLGFKVLNVPLIMGVYWAILTYSTASISKLISNHHILAAISGAVLTTSLDLLIEVSASRFDYWRFEQGFAPIQNYIGWFAVSFVVHLIFQKVLKNDHFMLSFHIFTAMTMFFSVFTFF